jgi:ABC-type Fe3+-hydroxamate transport system substrate-binding protein
VDFLPICGLKLHFVAYFVTSVPRIVSLVPSITELLVDMGLAPWLVGRTGFCIHPQQVLRLIPKVGGTKDVNLRKIQQLAPTHVIVNMDENELHTVDKLREFVPQVIVTHPRAPQDNVSLIEQLEAVFATYSAALDSMHTPATRLKKQIFQRLERLKPCARPAQRVLYLIWRDPWMTVARDTYISRMLELIGWQTWPDQLGQVTGASRYPQLTGDEPWLRTMDRVLLSSEPYRFGPHHLQEVQNWLPQAKVQLIDGELISWYGSRAVKGLDYLMTLAESAKSSA